MNYELKVPKFAQGATVIKIKQWLCKPGDKVIKGEEVAEATTDKIAIFIEAQNEGYISELLAEEGEEVRVGQVIAIISSKLGESDIK